MFTFCWSFHTMGIELELTLVPVSCHFIFTLCPIVLAITFLFGQTAPQQFIILACKSSNNFGDKQSMYNLCPTFSVQLRLHEWLSAEFCVSYFCLNTQSSFSRHYTFQNHIAYTFYADDCIFLWYRMFENDSVFAEHNNFKC